MKIGDFEAPVAVREKEGERLRGLTARTPQQHSVRHQQMLRQRAAAVGAEAGEGGAGALEVAFRAHGTDGSGGERVARSFTRRLPRRQHRVRRRREALAADKDGVIPASP